MKRYIVCDGVWVKGEYTARSEAEQHVQTMREAFGKEYTIEVQER